MNFTQVIFDPAFDGPASQEDKYLAATLTIGGNSYDIYNKENVIGRDEHCDIVIRNLAVSSRHAVVEVEDRETHIISDLGSTNKTKLDKITLKPHVKYYIRDGEKITFGNVEAIYKYVSRSEEPVVSRQDEKPDNSIVIPESPDKSDDPHEIICESPYKDPLNPNNALETSGDLFQDPTTPIGSIYELDTEPPEEFLTKIPNRVSHLKVVRKIDLDTTPCSELTSSMEIIPETCVKDKNQSPASVVSINLEGLKKNVAVNLNNLFALPILNPAKKKVDELNDSSTSDTNKTFNTSKDSIICQNISVPGSLNQSVTNCGEVLESQSFSISEWDINHVTKTRKEDEKTCDSTLTGDKNISSESLVLPTNSIARKECGVVLESQECSVFDLATQPPSEVSNNDISSDNALASDVRVAGQNVLGNNVNDQDVSIFDMLTQEGSPSNEEDSNDYFIQNENKSVLNVSIGDLLTQPPLPQPGEKNDGSTHTSEIGLEAQSAVLVEKSKIILLNQSISEVQTQPCVINNISSSKEFSKVNPEKDNALTSNENDSCNSLISEEKAMMDISVSDIPTQPAIESPNSKINEDNLLKTSSNRLDILGNEDDVVSGNVIKINEIHNCVQKDNGKIQNLSMPESPTHPVVEVSERNLNCQASSDGSKEELEISISDMLTQRPPESPISNAALPNGGEIDLPSPKFSKMRFNKQANKFSFRKTVKEVVSDAEVSSKVVEDGGSSTHSSTIEMKSCFNEEMNISISDMLTQPPLESSLPDLSESKKVENTTKEVCHENIFDMATQPFLTSPRSEESETIESCRAELISNKDNETNSKTEICTSTEKKLHFSEQSNLEKVNNTPKDALYENIFDMATQPYLTSPHSELSNDNKLSKDNPDSNTSLKEDNITKQSCEAELMSNEDNETENNGPYFTEQSVLKKVSPHEVKDSAAYESVFDMATQPTLESNGSDESGVGSKTGLIETVVSKSCKSNEDTLDDSSTTLKEDVYILPNKAELRSNNVKDKEIGNMNNLSIANLQTQPCLSAEDNEEIIERENQYLNVSISEMLTQPPLTVPSETNDHESSSQGENNISTHNVKNQSDFSLRLAYDSVCSVEDTDSKVNDKNIHLPTKDDEDEQAEMIDISKIKIKRKSVVNVESSSSPNLESFNNGVVLEQKIEQHEKLKVDQDCNSVFNSYKNKDNPKLNDSDSQSFIKVKKRTCQKILSDDEDSDVSINKSPKSLPNESRTETTSLKHLKKLTKGSNSFDNPDSGSDSDSQRLIKCKKRSKNVILDDSQVLEDNETCSSRNQGFDLMGKNLAQNVGGTEKIDDSYYSKHNLKKTSLKLGKREPSKLKLKPKETKKCILDFGSQSSSAEDCGTPPEVLEKCLEEVVAAMSPAKMSISDESERCESDIDSPVMRRSSRARKLPDKYKESLFGFEEESKNSGSSTGAKKSLNTKLSSIPSSQELKDDLLSVVSMEETVVVESKQNELHNFDLINTDIHVPSKSFKAFKKSPKKLPSSRNKTNTKENSLKMDELIPEAEKSWDSDKIKELKSAPSPMMECSIVSSTNNLVAFINNESHSSEILKQVSEIKTDLIVSNGPIKHITVHRGDGPKKRGRKKKIVEPITLNTIDEQLISSNVETDNQIKIIEGITDICKPKGPSKCEEVSHVMEKINKSDSNEKLNVPEPTPSTSESNVPEKMIGRGRRKKNIKKTVNTDTNVDYEREHITVLDSVSENGANIERISEEDDKGLKSESEVNIAVVPGVQNIFPEKRFGRGRRKQNIDKIVNVDTNVVCEREHITVLDSVSENGANIERGLEKEGKTLKSESEVIAAVLEVPEILDHNFPEKKNNRGRKKNISNSKPPLNSETSTENGLIKECVVVLDESSCKSYVNSEELINSVQEVTKKIEHDNLPQIKLGRGRRRKQLNSNDFGKPENVVEPTLKKTKETLATENFEEKRATSKTIFASHDKRKRGNSNTKDDENKSVLLDEASTSHASKKICSLRNASRSNEGIRLTTDKVCGEEEDFKGFEMVAKKCDKPRIVKPSPPTKRDENADLVSSTKREGVETLNSRPDSKALSCDRKEIIPVKGKGRKKKQEVPSVENKVPVKTDVSIEYSLISSRLSVQTPDSTVTRVGRNKRSSSGNVDEDLYTPTKKVRKSRVDLQQSFEETSSESGTPRTRSSDKKNMEYVMFTGISDPKMSSIIKKLGGKVVDSPPSCTVLVTDEFRRTVKFLCALGKGCPIVTPEWINASQISGSFVDPNTHLLHEKEAEKKFSFSLKTSIEMAKKQRLLAGWNIFVTKSVKPPPKEMKSIVECCGGVFLGKEPASWPDNSAVISCTEDKSKWRNLKRAGITPPILSSESILSGVLQQKFNTSDHRLN